MEYLLHDLIRLPLSDRLYIIEQTIRSVSNEDPEQRLLHMLQELNETIHQTRNRRS